MNDTATSRATIATNSANGIRVTKLTRILEVNRVNRNPPRIFISECPAARLASSRTPSDRARARYEISSIGARIGTRAIGVPAGRKNEKKCSLWILSPRIVTPIKIITLRPSETTRELPTVNPYGTLPTRLENSRKKNSE